MPEANPYLPLEGAAPLSLNDLNIARLEAKEAEAQAKRNRTWIEEAMIAHPECQPLPESGTTTLAGLVKIVTKYSRKWDQTKLAQLREREGITAENWPFKTEWKENGTVMKYLREAYPDFIQDIEVQALTLTPSKPSFTEVTTKK